jgi:uncharacterized membrane protein
VRDGQQIERQMGRLLQFGVLVSAVIMTLGGLLYLAAHGGDTTNLSRFHKADWSDSTRLLQLGVLSMIATPVLRVVFGVLAFARARDWLYASVSATVLGLIAWGFIHPH